MIRATLIAIFLSVAGYCQTGAKVAKYTLPLIAGMADGLKERISYHYYTIPDTWNQQFWNPQLSWRNKWKNGDPNQGEAFPLSSTTLVFLTDGYHLLRTANRWAWIGCATISIQINTPKKWYLYLIDMATHWLGFVAGFHLTYR